MTASWLGSLDDGMVDGTEMEVDSTPMTFAQIPEEDEWKDVMDEDNEANEANEEDDTPSFFKEEAERLSKSQQNKTKSKKPKTRVAELVREKISKVLQSTGLADKRAGKCDENDFLRLLLAFNAEGIHFA